MALGGGTFVSQNKILPGSYINFVSLAKTSSQVGDRGIAAIGLELDWGADDELIVVETQKVLTDSLKLFGYPFTHDKMQPIRELLKSDSHTLVTYNLQSGGVKAENTYATAKYPGVRGNDIRIIIKQNADNDTLYDVSTALDGKVYDRQTVASASELQSNDWVDFKSGTTLTVTAGDPLTGGANGTVDGASHQRFLDLLESQAFNTLGLASADTSTASLYAAYTSRQRDVVGKKFQTVVYNADNPDTEGVINLFNKVTDEGVNESALVYWVTGQTASAPINRSLLNQTYTGEYTVDVDFKQSELEEAIEKGYFLFHLVGDDVRILADNNSLVSYTEDKGEIFQDNQTMRIVDQIAMDIAGLFNEKYLGKVPNDNAGRISLKADIIKHHKQLEQMRAIQDFDPDVVEVEKGDHKKSVVIHDQVSVINTMAQLYMTVVVE